MADTTDPTLENEGADNRDEGRPDWLPDNFKSPEDLAKSYQEAQRKITELGQQNKGLEESIAELTTQWDQFVEQQNQPDPNDVRNQLLAMYENDPVGTMAQIAQQTAQQVLQQNQQTQQQPQQDIGLVASYAADQMANRYQDWPEYAPAVAELVKSNPLLQSADMTNLQTITQVLEAGYKLAKADAVISGDAAQREAAAAARTAKLAAQTATGATGRPDISPDAAQKRWEEIMSANSGRLKF